MNRFRFIGMLLVIVTGLLTSSCKKNKVIVQAFQLPYGSVFLCEDQAHPKLQSLRQNEHLDEIWSKSDGQPEINRLIGLTQWSKNLFPATSPFPDYPPWDANVILNMIRTHKTGGFCAQYAFIYGQACQSLGYYVRYFDLTRSQGDPGHFMLEVYVPSLNQWIAIEPEFGHAYQNKEQKWLSVYDLHLYACGLRKGKVYRVPEHTEVEANFLSLFNRIRYYLRTNFLSMPVFVNVIPYQGRITLNFEHDRISDIYSVQGVHIDTSTIRDFPSVDDFTFQLFVSTMQTKSVETYGALVDALRGAGLYQVRRFEIPSDVFDEWKQRVLGDNQRYDQLTSGLNSMVDKIMSNPRDPRSKEVRSIVEQLSKKP